MIHKKYLVLITISLIIFLPNHSLKAKATLNIGDSFIYDIEEASGYYSYNLTSDSANLYRVSSSAAVDVGSELNITIDKIIPSSIDYLAYENTTYLDYCNITSFATSFTSTFDNILSLFILSIFSSGGEPEWGNKINYAYTMFFIQDDIVLDDLFDYYNGSLWNESLEGSQYTAGDGFFLGTSYAWINGGDILILESMQDGLLYNVTENTYVDVYYDNRLDYDVIDRYLLGSYSNILMNGTLKGLDFFFSTNIKVVLQGYSGLDTPIINEFTNSIGIELIILSTTIFGLNIIKKKRRNI